MQKKKKKKTNSQTIFKWTFSTIKFILTTPIYLSKFIIKTIDKAKEESKKEEIERKRALIKPLYEQFNEVEKISGSLKEWEDYIINSDSTIGIILGARGTGKTALALKFFENIYKKKKTKIYAMGFNKEEMPSWIKTLDSIEKITNNSYILIDEGGVIFNSRNSTSKPNKLLSELMLIARHKNLSILFISQNSSNLEVNILRQADYLLLKPSSLLQKNFERKIIKDIYTQNQELFTKYKNDKGLFYIHSDKFMGFASNPLPSFWNESISKSWNKK